MSANNAVIKINNMYCLKHFGNDIVSLDVYNLLK